MEAIDEAGRRGADLIVLPEEPDLIGCPVERRSDLPEPIPGGATVSRFCKRAAANRLYVVYTQRERDGGAVYNAAVIIDRRGKVVGTYRKTHLAPGEETEVKAGESYPVFDCDFGRIAVGICMDIHYPEIWRIYALEGAEILCFPTQCLDYTGDHIESICNVRTIDNQVYFVSSHFIQYPFLSGRSMGHSRVIDPYGRTLADTSHRPGVAFAEIDLDAGFETWYTGELKTRYPTLKDCYLGMRRPETYRRLIEPDGDSPVWKRSCL
jgi:predicted amidohydrolase